MYTSQIEGSTRYGMDDSLYDKCGCGATKLASKEKCTNCWLDSQHYNWIVGKDKCSACGMKTKSGSLYCSECLEIKNGICAKEGCNNRFTGSRGDLYCALHLPSKERTAVSNTSADLSGEIKKCINCKNHAKKGSDMCSPCQKVERGICGKKDCNNRVSRSKGHRYCGVHLPLSKSSPDFKICAHCNSYAPRGQKLCARCKSGHKISTINSSKSQIQCRVCKKTLQPRSVGERAARGTAGAGMGTVVGGIIGSLVGPLGTVVGAGLGGFFGSTDGSQIENLCENCCGLCENKKSECICNHIIGLCRSCGCNVTRSNSSNGYCWECQGPWFGDDL